jgi:hypothetical protein
MATRGPAAPAPKVTPGIAINDLIRFGSGKVVGMTYEGGTFCVHCGWFIAHPDRDYTGDTSCDACGSDLGLNPDVKAWVSGASDEPVMPDASWSKDAVKAYLDDAGIAYDARLSIGHLLDLVS